MPGHVESGLPQPTEDLTPTRPPQEVHDRFPDLQERFQELIEKIRIRFGDNSGVTAHIVHMSRLFAAQGVTKREAYTTIHNELQNDSELQQHFRTMFSHPDTSWTPSDFEPLPEMPEILQPENDSPELSQLERVAQGTPQRSETLRTEQDPSEAAQHDGLVTNVQKLPGTSQPENLSQITLPSLRSWYNVPPHPSSINPSLLTERFRAGDGNNCTAEHNSTHRMPQPSFATSHEHEHMYLPTYADNHLTSSTAQSLAGPAPGDSLHGHSQYVPLMQQQTYLASLADSSNGSDPTSPSFCDAEPQVQRSYAANETLTLAHDNHGHTQDSGTGDDHNRRQNVSADWTQYGSMIQLASPSQSFMFTAPSVVAPPGMSDPREPLFEFPSPRQTSNTSCSSHDPNHGNGIHGQDDSVQQDHVAVHVRAKSGQGLPSPNASNADTRSSRPQTKFIHSLCGKSFGTRHGVKKHHWGAKLNDFNTETGCWAKHGKPDVPWDDHPSCKDTTPKANIPKPLAMRLRPAEGEGLVPPVAPPNNPRRSESLVDMPMVQSLPRAFDETLQPHQRHYLRSQGTTESLDALLTVVNAASTIDARILQDRHDSFISRPDTQITALHQDCQSLPDQGVLASSDVAQYYITPRTYRTIAPALMNEAYIPQHSFAQQYSLGCVDSRAMSFSDDVGNDGSQFRNVEPAEETPARAPKKRRRSGPDMPTM